jgi:hypothetical protein
LCAELAGPDSDLNSLVALVSRGDPSIAPLSIESMEYNGVTTAYGSGAAATPGDGSGSGSGGLSTGAIIGIAVGAVVALGALIAGALLIRHVSVWNATIRPEVNGCFSFCTSP